jgi:hypothetical protein
MSNGKIRVPKSAVRQNLIYSIESLARRASQIEAAQCEVLNEEEKMFFAELHRELDTFRAMAVHDVLLRQVYIYQKLFDISRDLFQFSHPADIQYQFLFLQRLMSAEIGSMSAEDKAAFNDLREQVQALDKKEGQTKLSVSRSSSLRFFWKIVQDRQLLTIWNSEQLNYATLRLGGLLLFGALGLFILAVTLFQCDKTCGYFGYTFSIDGVRLLAAIFGGITGGCLSGILNSRRGADADQVPLINVDWMRPVLGATAGLVYGLLVTTGVGEVKPSFLIGGAIAFGFSEQVLYSWLQKRAQQLEKDLGHQVGQRQTKPKR